MVLKKFFNYFFTHKFFTFLVVSFCCFIMFSFNNESSAHSEYYDNLQNLTQGRAWVLYRTYAFGGNGRMFLAVSPDNRIAYTIDNWGTDGGYTYGRVFFKEKYANQIIKSNYYEVFTDGTLGQAVNGYGWEIGRASYTEIIDINKSTYKDDGVTIAYNVADFAYQYPFIENTTSDIENWSFDALNINGGDVSPYWQNISTTPIYYQNYRFYLDITTNGITYSNDIYKFVEINNDTDTFYITIPRQALSSYFNINDGQSVNFYLRLKAVLPNGEVYENDGFDLGTYTLSLTAQQVTDINDESNKFTQGSIEENQKETNQKLDDLNSNINDSNISDITNNTLPSDSTQDVTADGVNGIFTSIYNAFCTGTPQDIVFPVPFTNKNITLSPNYVVDMLTSSGATFVITLIQAFWWYLISRFIVKDIMNKINKIKSGNIEKIEETNIRGDML